MNHAIKQLEARLARLEQLRTERKAWLHELMSPVEERLEELSKMRHQKNVEAVNNVIQFPLDRRLQDL